MYTVFRINYNKKLDIRLVNEKMHAILFIFIKHYREIR